MLNSECVYIFENIYIEWMSESSRVIIIINGVIFSKFMMLVIFWYIWHIESYVSCALKSRVISLLLSRRRI